MKSLKINIKFKSATETGFTLIEMSLVIIIAGLLMVTFLGGQNLVNAAKLRSTAGSLTEYESAIISFKSYYEGLPGDMGNIFAIWGAELGCTDELSAAGGTGCNGDSDSIILWDSESYRAWQLLGHLHYIKGNYSGTSAVSGESVIGVNAPKSKFANGGFSILQLNSGDLGDFGTVVLGLGAHRVDSRPENGLFNFISMSSLDDKIDNGVMFGADAGKLGWDDGADSSSCGSVDDVLRCQAFYQVVK